MARTPSIILSLAVAAIVLPTTEAQAAAPARLQAETLTLGGSASAVQAKGAQGRRAARLRDRASLKLTIPATTTALAVRWRRAQCADPVKVRLTGAATSPAATRGWATNRLALGASAEAAPTRQVALAITGARHRACAADIDWIEPIGPAGGHASPAPAPKVKSGAAQHPAPAQAQAAPPAAATTAASTGSTLTPLLSVPAATTAPGGWFSPSSFWREPLAANTPLDVRSANYVQTLTTQALFGAWSPWIETTKFSTPVYRVGPTQPMVKVTLDTSWSLLAGQFAAVPIPVGAVPATGSDHHLVIYQASTDTMWEFYRAELKADGWHARWGGRMQQFSTNPGYFADAERSHGATATGLPLLGGLMTIEELRAQKIDHALAMAIPTASPAVVWPAQRGDGTSTEPDAIPSGTRFRIDPALNVDALAVSAVTKAMVRAAQKYGVVVRDTTGSSVNFYAESPVGSEAGAYTRPTGVFGKQWADQIMRSFPWDRLQAIAPPATTPVP